MTLTLRLENPEAITDGGPAEVTVTGRVVTAGRSGGVDWVLPDPQRHVSSRHFEVRPEGDGFWLIDTSTNGTFLAGSGHRLDGPHRLQDGDRFLVGHYRIVAVVGATPQFSSDDRGFSDDPWALTQSRALAPVDPLPAPPQSARADFADEFIANPIPAALPPAAFPFVAAPAPASPPPPLPQSPPAPNILHAFCEGAGLDPALANGTDPEALARQAGESLRVVTDALMTMLRDRASARQFATGTPRTMRRAEDNNPLKFLPDTDQALSALLLRPRAGFHTGAAGFADALNDLRHHQVALFAALQPALSKLMDGFAPEDIEAEVGAGLLAGNRRAKSWDIYVQKWDSRASAHEAGILGEFLLHFAKAYAEPGSSPPSETS